MIQDAPKSAAGHLVLGESPSQRREPQEFVRSFDSSHVPAEPGCYLMQDESRRVIYVGKAKNLRARLRAYLSESDSRHTVKFLMRRVSRVEFLVTATEKEALLLENSLIKEHKPRYNFRLKDDKTYVSVKVNVRHEFPRVTVTRTIKRDGSRYFGPYSSANAVRETLRQVQRVFPLRVCSDIVLRNRTRPCLYHQMGQCTAPCVGLINHEEYRQIVEQVLLMLEGRSAEVEKLLMEQIRGHADRLEFEKAAQVRDRLLALRKTLERQRTAQSGDTEDRDVFGVHTQGRYSEIQVLYFRAGKMTGGRSFSFNHREMPLDETLSSLLTQYYSQSANIPIEVLLPFPIEDAATLEEMLSEKRGGKVGVLCPQRGEKRALVELAARNARTSFEEKRLADQANKDLLEQVRAAFKLSKEPDRIECFDISTTQGDKPVGVMVAFEGGVANKSRYRRFGIREVQGQDDFAMLREVLMRRFTRAIEENDLPDVVLIDGGKGQLNVATAVFKDLGIDDLDTLSIAKSRADDEGGHSPERFFTPGRKNPIILPQNGPVVLFLARIRDEAHRFAIAFHRKRRDRAVLRTPLTEVPGIGEKRARMLLRTLGSLRGVREASVEKIAALPGINEALAAAVSEYVRNRSDS